MIDGLHVMLMVPADSAVRQRELTPRSTPVGRVVNPVYPLLHLQAKLKHVFVRAHMRTQNFVPIGYNRRHSWTRR